MQTAPQVLKANLLKTAIICTIFPSLMFQTLHPQFDALTVLVVLLCRNCCNCSLESNISLSPQYVSENASVNAMMYVERVFVSLLIASRSVL